MAAREEGNGHGCKRRGGMGVAVREEKIVCGWEMGVRGG